MSGFNSENKKNNKQSNMNIQQTGDDTFIIWFNSKIESLNNAVNELGTIAKNMSASTIEKTRKKIDNTKKALNQSIETIKREFNK
jgi:hypothetical protein